MALDHTLRRQFARSSRSLPGLAVLEGSNRLRPDREHGPGLVPWPWSPVPPPLGTAGRPDVVLGSGHAYESPRPGPRGSVSPTTPLGLHLQKKHGIPGHSE